MRTIIWFIYFWAYLAVIWPKLLRAEKMAASGEREAAFEIAAFEAGKWARSLLRLAGVRLNITGKENIPKETAIFVGNHQGNFDIPILLGHLGVPCGVLAKVELEHLPLVSRWMRLLDCVFVDRKNPRQSISAINDAAQIVRGGHSMIIFPEGTRSKCNEVGEFKSGAFKLASKALVPIVPICMDGTFKIMEQQGFWIRPAEVNVKILPPIYTSELSRDELRELEERVRSIIIENK